MGNSCNALNVRPIKISQLASYSSLKSDDLILITENDGSNLYSRKTTFGNFVNSITSLTSSLSGNVTGKFTGSMSGALFGNLTGNVLGGTIKGTFSGTGSIVGIPFKSLNDQNISFDGISSYSVTSSYSLLSNYSKTNFSSSYSLTSSYGKTTYSVTAKSSSYAKTSSLAKLANLSLLSLQSNLSDNSYTSQYSYDGLYAVSSSYSPTSTYSVSSSFANTSSFVKSGSFANFSTTSSYAFNCENKNIVKAFMTIVGSDANQFRALGNNILNFTSMNGYNIKSIRYLGRRRIWGVSQDQPTPVGKTVWWPTFYVEFLNPVKYTNYIVQGTIWEVDIMQKDNSSEDNFGDDCEIGTFQIPFFQAEATGSYSNYNRTTTGFFMTWQGGLRLNSQRWMASFYVIGGDTAFTTDPEQCKCE